MENESPIILEKNNSQFKINLVDGKLLDVTRESVFQLLRNILDPEHPYSLEQLGVISLEDITITDLFDDSIICSKGQHIKSINVIFTPTVPHCSMAGIIGLAVAYTLNIKIKEGSHSTENALNKQLSDKERVMAAFENEALLEVITRCTNVDF